MAPPPKYLLTRSLIRKYFENNLPTMPSYIKLKDLPIMKCWEKYGPGDIACKNLEEDFDEYFKEVNRFRQEVKDSSPMKLVMSQLKKPLYHFKTKGRNRRHTHERTIYDGIM